MDISKTIRAIILLDTNGKRALAKYFDDKIKHEHFEKQIYSRSKSREARDDVLLVDGYLIVHRRVANYYVYIVGGRNENPLILDKFICCLVEVLATLLTNDVADVYSAEKEYLTIFDAMDQVILALDELCDNGIILETDPNLILQRVCLRDGVVEQSMARVLQQAATGQLKFPWIRS